ncbi:hypothetical protein D3C87_370700 [compost metagenome]
MISFKSFVKAIHSAIVDSSDQLMGKNLEIFHKYFESREEEVVEADGTKKTKSTLVPRTVTLTYPQVNEIPESNEKGYALKMAPVEVPLVTLVPMTLCNIEKATFTAEFEMEIVQDALQINFVKPRSEFVRHSPGHNIGKLEITLSPHETAEGLKLLMESYENFLKRQIT